MMFNVSMAMVQNAAGRRQNRGAEYLHQKLSGTIADERRIKFTVSRF